MFEFLKHFSPKYCGVAMNLLYPAWQGQIALLCLKYSTTKWNLFRRLFCGPAPQGESDGDSLRDHVYAGHAHGPPARASAVCVRPQLWSRGRRRRFGNPGGARQRLVGVITGDVTSCLGLQNPYRDIYLLLIRSDCVFFIAETYALLFPKCR